MLFRAGVSFEDSYRLTRKQIASICNRVIDEIKAENEFRTALLKSIAKLGGAK